MRTRRSPFELLVVGVLASAVLAVLAWPWLRDAAHAIPDEAAAGNPWMGADARLIVWILCWDVHALLEQPLALFDANILHPAPGMLAGSEHLLSTALLFAPTWLASGNPVLAANLTALATYVLAAVCMFALARRVGLPAAAAAVAAVSFALGPLRVPGDLHILQYPNYVLPLLLVALIAFDTRGGFSRALGVVAAAALAAFSSYYLAAMAGCVIGIELMLLTAKRRFRRALRLVAVLAPVAAALALVSLPYLESAPLGGSPGATLSGYAFQIQLLDPSNPSYGAGWPVALLALVGLFAPVLTRRAPAQRWWRWVALAAVGWLFALGPVLRVFSVDVPLPWAALANTPLAALAGVSRFAILSNLGVVGLAAEGAALLLSQSARSIVLRPLRPALGITLALAAAAPRATDLAALPRSELPTGDAVPEVYRWLAVHAAGPLLELPGSPATQLRESESMVLSTYHWLPLVNGHTKFKPWWWQGAIGDELGGLPRRDTLQTLVDLTGVRWILLRRDSGDVLAARAWSVLLAGSAGVERIDGFGEDQLYRVTLEPRRPWAERLARRRPEPGETPLGTPIAVLAEAQARGGIEAPQRPKRVLPGRPLFVAVQVRNDGSVDWPGLAPPGASDRHLVVIEAVWRPREGGEAGANARIRLPRDVRAGERMFRRLELSAPDRPGAYTLELSLRQVGGPGFRRASRARVPVIVRAPEPADEV